MTTTVAATPIYFSRSVEKRFRDRGYRHAKLFGTDYAKAVEYAVALRATGRAAIVAEYSTRIRGYHEFSVWSKQRETKTEE